MKFILGKKIEMTQIWKGNDVVAVTKVQVGPCVVTQIKNNNKDGYNAVQLGYGERKEKNIAKPQKGHLAKLKTSTYTKAMEGKQNSKLKTNLRYLKEFKIEEDVKLNTGDVIDASTFELGDTVKVTGTSKGKGFQGVVKRHGFHGQNKSHGTKDQLRMPGSIGATGPAHVFKGVRMPGRMGGDRVSTANLEIIDIDKENNVLYIKGAVPGARNGLVLISGNGELKIINNEQLTINNKEKDEVKVEAENENNDNKENKADDVNGKAIDNRQQTAEADESESDKKKSKTEEKNK